MNKCLLIFAILCVSVIPFEGQSLPLASLDDPQPCSFQLTKLKAPATVEAKDDFVQVFVDLETTDCSIPINIEIPAYPGPAKIMLKSRTGLSDFNWVNFSMLEPSVISSPERRAHSINTHFSIHTSLDLAVGNEPIEAQLVYNAVDRSGKAVEGHFDFAIPLNVIARNPPTFWQRHEKTKNILVNTGIGIAVVATAPVWLVLACFGLIPG